MVLRDHFSVPHEYIIYIGEKKQNKTKKLKHNTLPTIL